MCVCVCWLCVCVCVCVRACDSVYDSVCVRVTVCIYHCQGSDNTFCLNTEEVKNELFIWTRENSLQHIHVYIALDKATNRQTAYQENGKIC